MTTAQRLRSEGRVEGRGELLLELLALKFGPLSDAIRSRVADASPEQISTWSSRLIAGATTVDDVLR